MRGAARIAASSFSFRRPPPLFAARPRLRAMACVAAAAGRDWRPMDGITADELTLEHTLPTGQTFRWRKTGAHTYTGVIGRRVVQLRQQQQQLKEEDPKAPPSPSSSCCCWWRLASRPPAGADPSAELAAAERDLRDYLNMGSDHPRLAELARGWAASDARYAAVAAGLPGARMLRQNPLECLFSFVCSSNNHISRIHGMVERLCSRYGSEIELEPWAARELAALAKKGEVVPATPATLGSGGGGAEEQTEEEQMEEGDVVVEVELVVPTPGGSGKKGGHAKRGAGAGATAATARGDDDDADAADAAAPAFWAFPTLEQLAAASEEALRADGFGYRARYIAGSVALLRAKQSSAAAASAAASGAASTAADDDWLLSLRSPDVPLERAVELLTELPGVGPKVASCVALFSLDKHAAVPVDTHVWDLAKRYYAREALRGKAAPQAALHPIVQKAFIDAFGPYAGWAHNALFVGELPAFQGRVSAAARRAAGGKKGGAGAAGGSGSEDEDEDDNDDAGDDSDFELHTPAAKSSSGAEAKKRKSKAPSPASVAREERRRRRSRADKEAEGGGAPLPFADLESVLS